ncbi:hypothetical protein [Paenibacillus caseinilyticus]|uniref:hypothetical protein n=1 Tax=Paenibacillus caseinilyticus TaxID=3098138 RepID=UPI0022B8E312|nr:hypothetical protein [Paenibacillus caseinilyticus]MCZ8521882.1 hypothetical protein [Paenibacillus caseinilyticus]
MLQQQTSVPNNLLYEAAWKAKKAPDEDSFLGTLFIEVVVTVKIGLLFLLLLISACRPAQDGGPNGVTSSCSDSGSEDDACSEGQE